MKKRILSVLLAFAMIFTLMPTALAAPTTYQVVTVDKTTVQAGETVNVKVTLPNITEKAGTFTVNLKFDTTLFEVVSRAAPPKISATDEGFGSQDDVKIFANTAAIANTSGELTANASYTYNTMEVAGVTVIDATLKAKASGTAAFSFTTFEITKSEGGTQYIVKKDQLETPPSVTIPKAPITSVSAKVDAPQKGVALDTSVDLGSATAYTGAVKWYVGETEATETIAKANTEYTAKITLTANPGESFDAALDSTTTTEGYEVKKVSNTELLLTKTFDATADKDPLPAGVSVSITGTPQIDKPLTANVSGLPTSPGALTYKWYRDGETESISGANTNTYTPSVAADVGKQIKVEVSAANYSGHVTSAPTAAVEKKDYVGSAAVLPTGVTPTYNSVSFTGTAGQEYVCTPSSVTTAPDTGWASVNRFDGLNSNTQYKLWCRVAATDTVKPSTARGDSMFTTFKAPATITIADPGTIVYDGSAVEGGPGKDLSYTYGGDGAVTVKWYADNSGSIGSALTGAPTNAGTYWIGVSAAEGTNSAAVSEVTKKFTISQRNISEVTVTAIADQEYTGSSIEPTLTVTYNGTPLTSGTDYTVEYTSNLNVGTATAKIKAKTGSNFTGEKVVTFKIKAKAITPVVSVTGSYEYTGDPITPTYKVEITSGGMELPANQYDAVVSDNTNAGNGNIKITAKANGNYSFSEVNKTFTIAAKDVSGLTATISDQTTIKGVGEFVDPVIKGVKGEDLTGTLAYGYDSETGKSHAEVVTMLKGKNVNDVVTLTYTFTPPTGNYTGTKTGSFKVTVKDIEFLVGTAPASVANALDIKTDPTYGDDWSKIVKIKDGVTITAKVGTNTDTDQSHFTLRPTGKPNAGNGQTYELVYNGTINGTNYANVVVASGTVDVAPKTLTAADLTHSGPITKVYDTNTNAPTGLTVSVKSGSLVGTDTLAVTGTLKYNSANVNEANKITFTPDAITTGNYALAVSEVLTITGAKITQATPTYTVPTGLTAKYGQTLADVNIAATTGWSWMNTGTAVGTPATKNFPAKFTPTDAINYKTVENIDVSVAVSKADAPTLTNITVSQKYTVDTEQSKNIGTAGMPADAGTLTYTAGSSSVTTGTATVSSFTVDSTGMVKYTITGGADGAVINLPVTIDSDNYAGATVNVVITLTAKDNQAALTLTGGTTVVYGQTLQLGTSGGSGTGAVTYAVTNGTGEATIDATGKLTPVKVGTVKVKATKAADASFNEATSAEVEITITRATPTGAPKYTAITTSGKTLADAGLTTVGSTLNPNAGTLVWVDNTGTVLSDTTAVAANTTYKWLFTPTDANYTTLTGFIELYHKSSSGGGGWYYTYYTIKATAGTNGSISPSGWTSVRDGRDQTFTITPDKGYAVAKVLVDGKSVGAVKSYTFKNVTKDHTIEAIFMKSNGNPQTGVFVDVAEGSYYEEAIDWAVEKGITNGVSSNMFAPNDPCTRAQIVTFLWRAAGSPAPKSMSSFTDVPADAFYAKAVAWAVENGITSGTGESKFSPNATCTRAQAVTFLYRASGSPAVSGSAEFSDVATNAYYADAVAWAAKKGITTGIGGGLFGSDNDCTRGQIVTFLWRAMAE